MKLVTPAGTATLQPTIVANVAPPSYETWACAVSVP